MKTSLAQGVFGCMLGLIVVGLASAGPPLREEGERREKLTAELKQSLAAETTVAGKVTILASAMKAEPSSDVRRVVLDHVPTVTGPELDAFLSDVLTNDPDAGIRSRAAIVMGKLGSDKCLMTLTRAAAMDRTTTIQMGCIRGQSSARRQATFAIPQLARRFPKLVESATDQVRALAPAVDPKDPESLADARIQALYQLTRDETLLKPFYDRMQSDDTRTRETGVIAFRFLDRKTAPPELIAALQDKDEGVRAWTTLVLGEIADPKTIPLLLTIANDAKETEKGRCGAIGSLGRMKALPAADSMRKLLLDPSESIQTSAAIALYQITGEKVKQYPKGYRAD